MNDISENKRATDEVLAAKRYGLIVTVLTEHITLDLPARFAPELRGDWVTVYGYHGVQDSFPARIVRGVSAQPAVRCPICGESVKPVGQTFRCPFCTQMLRWEDKA